MANVYHVSIDGSDDAEGSASSPYASIGQAAAIAQPGDTILVHEGEYREWVDPVRGGLSDRRRITYAAAPDEHVVIKGSEVLREWFPEEGDVWRAEVPNSLFGDFNPFQIPIEGDWVVRPFFAEEPKKHLGAVYLDGRRMYEADNLADLLSADVQTEVLDDWTGTTVEIEDSSWTARRWYAEISEDCTTIWGNFGGVRPNEALVEINVRPTVFFPRHNHVDFITVRGFELAHAATQWAPPTAAQDGLIGPNWSRGWVIEDNVIHDSVCVGISLGKEVTTGDNFALVRGDKPGYQYQLESVFLARQVGWDREHIGSHIVRRNTVYNCGQAGIAGHLGCVFSTIEDNHIHHIAILREFYGHEIAGIKLHAALDVQIKHNRIHDCSLGTWLDWETQGTRLSRNIYFRNQRDLFVEVSHGPYVVDHNVFASRASIEVFSQGGAFVENLVAGTVRLEPVMDRATPYHRPHSTQMAGFAVICGGDDRWQYNLFLGGDGAPAYSDENANLERVGYGTSGYSSYPESFEAYLSDVASSPSDHERFYGRHLPAYINGNAYAAGAEPFAHETLATLLSGPGAIEVQQDGPEVFIDLTVPEGLESTSHVAVSGLDLPRAYFADAEFEEPDGSPVRFDVDALGDACAAEDTRIAGPFHGLTPGSSRIRWK
ncbi:right-handed parallel beta-helix repeat-containing protein [Changpingibacter yushuensis]|uniref:right-handed parallel beta-helix repeat-containing protein n=1 Tax=Changpingibacter yushuensis TaxID=2758440 RepID=UPI00165D7ABD|nr:right-handed parallel beta-helix repeat-containing protein [Changpingibacter yushuensis]